MHPLIKPLVGMVIGLSLIGVAFHLTQSGKADKERAAVEARRKTFLAEQISPLIEAEYQSNLAAKKRAQQLLRANFRRYAMGIPGYLNEIASLRTKYELTTWRLADKIGDSTGARDFANQIFETHILSQAQLEGDLRKILAQFTSDLEASRNTLLVDASAKLATADFKVHDPWPDSQALIHSLHDEIERHLTTRALQAPLVSALSMTGSAVAEVATQAAVNQFVRMLAVRMAEGGASGSTVGPVGTVVGVVAGLAVGFVVDGWIEKRFEDKVEGEINNMLHDMQAKLWADDKEGMEKRLDEAITAVRDTHIQAFHQLVAN